MVAEAFTSDFEKGWGAKRVGKPRALSVMTSILQGAGNSRRADHSSASSCFSRDVGGGGGHEGRGVFDVGTCIECS